MKPDHPKTREGYFREASSWAQDQSASLRASRRVAWIVAGVLAVVAICQALALMLLTPLKTVEPYTLMVDKQTGFVQALQPLEPARVAGDTALTQSFLVQYVIARESFDINALQANYRKVALWSADSARSRYIAGFEAHLSAADGRNIAARACADDDHVIVCHWVDPLILERWYNVGIISVVRRCVAGYCGPGRLGRCPRR